MFIGIAYDAPMLRDVEIRQLRALAAVAEEGSFGRAAERLGFTQSAISQQIAGLERAVGDKVFDRPGGPKRVELTPIGSVLLDYARSLLGELQVAEDRLRSLRAGEVGRLVVGSFQSVSVNVLPEVVGHLRKERPGLTVRCIEDDENDLLIARLLAHLTGEEVFSQPLTYLLRTGAPDGQDLLGAANFAFRAAHLLEQGQFGRMTAFVKDRMWTDVGLAQAGQGLRQVDIGTMYDAAQYRPQLALIWSLTD